MSDLPSLTKNQEQQEHLKVNNNTLTKSEQEALLRSVLPSINGQEGSPCNTFTHSELKDLQKAVGSITVGTSRKSNLQRTQKNTLDIQDLQSSFHQKQQPRAAVAVPVPENSGLSAFPQDGEESCPQDVGS